MNEWNVFAISELIEENRHKIFNMYQNDDDTNDDVWCCWCRFFAIPQRDIKISTSHNIDKRLWSDGIGARQDEEDGEHARE